MSSTFWTLFYNVYISQTSLVFQIHDRSNYLSQFKRFYGRIACVREPLIVLIKNNDDTWSDPKHGQFTQFHLETFQWSKRVNLQREKRRSFKFMLYDHSLPRVKQKFKIALLAQFALSNRAKPRCLHKTLHEPFNADLLSYLVGLCIISFIQNAT